MEMGWDVEEVDLDMINDLENCGRVPPKRTFFVKTRYAYRNRRTPPPFDWDV